MEFFAIPAADTALHIGLVFRDWRIGFAKHHIRFVAGAGQRFDFGIGIRQFVQAGRRIVARAIILIIAATPGIGRRQLRQRTFRARRFGALGGNGFDRGGAVCGAAAATQLHTGSSSGRQ